MVAKAERFPSNGEGNRVDTSVNTEVLYSVDIRRIDVKEDSVAIVAIANIFNEPNVIEHLSGIAPAKTERNIRKFRENIFKYIPNQMLDTISEEGLVRIANNLIRATPVEIQDYFARFGNNAEVYVADVGGKIAGTATLEIPSGSGKMLGTISKVAVSEKAPKVSDSLSGKGIARRLIQTLEDRIVMLGLSGSEVSVIKSVNGRLAPLNLFLNQGYVFKSETQNGDLAWDNREGKYVFRDIVKLQHNIR